MRGWVAIRRNVLTLQPLKHILKLTLISHRRQNKLPATTTTNDLTSSHALQSLVFCPDQAFPLPFTQNNQTIEVVHLILISLLRPILTFIQNLFDNHYDF